MIRENLENIRVRQHTIYCYYIILFTICTIKKSVSLNFEVKRFKINSVSIFVITTKCTYWNCVLNHINKLD